MTVTNSDSRYFNLMDCFLVPIHKYQCMFAHTQRYPLFIHVLNCLASYAIFRNEATENIIGIQKPVFGLMPWHDRPPVPWVIWLSDPYGELEISVSKPLRQVGSIMIDVYSDTAAGVNGMPRMPMALIQSFRTIFLGRADFSLLGS